MTPSEIIKEWAKGCSNTDGNQYDCPICTAGMLEALRKQGIDLAQKLQDSQRVRKVSRPGFWARVWSRQ